MKNYTAIVLLLACALAMANCSAHGQGVSEAGEASCRASVQNFYDWYVANVRDGRNDWHIALKKRGRLFSRELSESLNKSDVESKVYGDPVLDFDPILATQDMGDHYVARKVTVSNNHCHADIYGVWARPVPNNGHTLNVVPELVFQNGRWIFVDFHYPGSGTAPSVDLLKILRSHKVK